MMDKIVVAIKMIRAMARQIGAECLKYTSAHAVTLRDKYCCCQAYLTNEAQGHLVALVAGTTLVFKLK